MSILSNSLQLSTGGQGWSIGISFGLSSSCFLGSTVRTGQQIAGYSSSDLHMVARLIHSFSGENCYLFYIFLGWTQCSDISMLNSCLVASTSIDTGSYVQKLEEAKVYCCGGSENTKGAYLQGLRQDKAPNPNTKPQSFYFAIIFKYHLFKFGMF